MMRRHTITWLFSLLTLAVVACASWLHLSQPTRNTSASGTVDTASQALSPDADASALPAEADGDLPLAGVFYGNPIGGVGTANASIALESSRRFRAERTGRLTAVRFHNRVLVDDIIHGRCAAGEPDSAWCACETAKLDAYTCGYTLGSSYSVGNGGSIVVELRPDDGRGSPGTEVLARTAPYVPMELKDTWYLQREFLSPGTVELGKRYHLVFRNLNPPTRCALSNVPVAQATNCPRDSGAIGLNGVFLVGEPSGTGLRGPWLGDTASANLYRRNIEDDWSLYPKTLSFFEVTYSDGVAVGETYHALDSMSDGQHTLQGETRGRQRFIVQQTDRRVNGVWLYFGHTSGASGTPLRAELKNSQGKTLASASLPASARCRHLVRGGDGFENTHCRDWGHGRLDKAVRLRTGREYFLELHADTDAGFQVSSYGSLSHFGFEDRNVWPDSRAQFSPDAGRTWQDWTSQYRDTRDLAMLFTLVGMPRQLR